MIYTSTCASPLGPLLLAAKSDALAGLWMSGQKYFPASLGETVREQSDHPVLRRAERWLERYFDGQRPAIGELRLAPEGSAFQKAVWALLCQIPYGERTTYGALAAKLAGELGRERMSARAVGGAVGRNPISIIIPCHRVVGASGSLTGYAGGVDRKIRLLKLEGASMDGLFIPTGGSAL